jgi:hypothetical protein
MTDEQQRIVRVETDELIGVERWLDAERYLEEVGDPPRREFFVTRAGGHAFADPIRFRYQLLRIDEDGTPSYRVEKV